MDADRPAVDLRNGGIEMEWSAIMVRIIISLLGAALMMSAAASVQADSYFDVEHARMTANAGGPVSDHDAELLERHGAYSGTPDWRRYTRGSYSYRHDGDDRPVRRKIRRHHRHN